VAAAGQPPWYSIHQYSYGVNDWRGNAVAENQLRRRPNDVPIDDVTSPRTGNGNAVVIATMTTTTTTAAAAATTTMDALRLVSCTAAICYRL